MSITSKRAVSAGAIVAGLGGGNASGTNAVAVGATLTNSLSTGNATNPNFVIQVGVKVASGAAQATATTALTIVGETLAANFAGVISQGGVALPTQVVQTTWTPTDGSGAALAFTGVSANYTKVGNMVYAYFQLTYPATADATAASIAGLPITTANATYTRGTAPAFVSTGVNAVLRPAQNATTAAFLNGASGVALTNVQLTGATIAVMLIYPAA